MSTKKREKERKREREREKSVDPSRRRVALRKSTSSRLYILRRNVSLSFRSPLDTLLLHIYESYREPRPLHRRAIKLLSLPSLLNRRISFVADLHSEKDSREKVRRSDTRTAGDAGPSLSLASPIYGTASQCTSALSRVNPRARAGSSPKSRGSPLYDLGYVLIFSCEGERRVSPTLQGKYTICRHRNSSSSIGHACIACPREREDEFPRLGAAGRDIVIEQSLVIETAELAFLPFLLLVARLAPCAPQLASLRAPAV